MIIRVSASASAGPTSDYTHTSDFRVSLYYKSIRRQNPILWAALSPDAFCGYLVARLFGLIEVAFDGTFGRFFKLFGHQFEALDL